MTNTRKQTAIHVERVSAAGIAAKVLRPDRRKSAAKAFLIAACLLLPGADAWAISRYDPTRMNCGQVQARIADEGAVLLRYRSPRTPALTLYDRYVAWSRFCDMGEVRERRTVPSADLGACTVYRCKSVDFDDSRHRFIFRGD